MSVLVQNAMLGAKDTRRRDNSRVWPEGHVIIPEAPGSLGLSLRNHVSLSDIYIPRISLHIFSSRTGRPIVGIYNSLTNTWMLKLGLRPRNSFSGNICFKFSAFCLCSVGEHGWLARHHKHPADQGKKGERGKAKNFVFAKLNFSSSSIAAKMIISEIVSQFYEYLHSHKACTRQRRNFSSFCDCT